MTTYSLNPILVNFDGTPYVSSSSVDSTSIKTNQIDPHTGNVITIGTVLGVNNLTNTVNNSGTLTVNTITPNSGNVVTVGTDLSVNNLTNIVDVTGTLQTNTINPHTGVSLTVVSPNGMSVNGQTGVVDVTGTLQTNTINPHAGSVVSFGSDGNSVTMNTSNGFLIANGGIDCNQYLPASGTSMNLNSNLVVNSTGSLVQVINNNLQSNKLDPYSGNTVTIGTDLSVNNLTNIVDVTGTLQTDLIMPHTGASNRIILGDGTTDIHIQKEILCNTYIPYSGNVITIGGVSNNISVNNLTNIVDVTGTLQTNTISPHSGTGTIISSTIVGGTGLTVPTNVDGGVIQLKALSDTTYASPTSSILLYCDSDNGLKTRNTSGQVVQISGIPIYGQMYYVSSFSQSFNSNTAIMAINQVMMSQDFSTALAKTNTYQYQYLGTATRNALVVLNINLTQSAASKQYRFYLYQNAVISGNPPVITGGTQVFPLNFFTNGTSGDFTISGNQYVGSIATNDTFTIGVQNATDTTALTITRVVFTINALSNGVD